VPNPDVPADVPNAILDRQPECAKLARNGISGMIAKDEERGASPRVKGYNGLGLVLIEQ
jgi:hypothetical protein